jgi:membrane protease YdiL (CAAX protease family)
VTTSTHSTPIASVRRRLGIFLVATFAITGAIQALIAVRGGPLEGHVLLVLAMMWTPGLVSLACRLAMREGIADVSFRLGRRPARSYLVAWLMPVAVGLLAYGPAWASGLETFEAPSGSSFGLDGTSGPLRFAVTVGIVLTLGTALSAISALGEEIGWRGYMLTRLIEARVPHPVLASGVIWGLWHVPLILSGQYAAGPYPLLSASMFMISIVAGAVVAADVRLRSGSVWPAVLFHSAWNAVIQGAFDVFTRGGGASTTTSIWIGESGILVVVASVLCAIPLVHRGIPVRIRPADEGVPTLRPGEL